MKSSNKVESKSEFLKMLGYSLQCSLKYTLTLSIFCWFFKKYIQNLHPDSHSATCILWISKKAITDSMNYRLILPWIFHSVFAETICGKYEKKLLRHLMADYDDMERPVEDENEPLQLVFGVTLQQIIDVVMNLSSRFCTVM